MKMFLKRSIYGLQEKCKNMVIRFQSPLVYVLNTLIAFEYIDQGTKANFNLQYFSIDASGWLGPP